MIRHTILFKVKPTVSTQGVENAMHLVSDLKNKLPGILGMIAGACHFHDNKNADIFSDKISHGVSIDFLDQESLDNFFRNPVALPAKNAIVNIAEEGYEGILGFDLNK